MGTFFICLLLEDKLSFKTGIGFRGLFYFDLYVYDFQCNVFGIGINYYSSGILFYRFENLYYYFRPFLCFYGSSNAQNEFVISAE